MHRGTIAVAREFDVARSVIVGLLRGQFSSMLNPLESLTTPASSNVDEEVS